MIDVMQIVLSAVDEASGAKPPEEVLAKLRRGEDVSFEDLKLDSLSRFEVIMQIEDALDIELDEDEIAANETVHAFASFVAERAAKG